MSISFNRINGLSKLFKDYIYSFNNVKSYYSFDYRNESGFEECINSLKRTYLGNTIFGRNEIADILRKQNVGFDASQKTLDNIELFRDDNTFAVVTGQQVGLLTGSYYTILKALNAVRLSFELKSMLPAYNFVPVFWMEDEDHDFLEINNINVFDTSNELKNISYFEKGEPKERYTKPVSMIKFDEHLDTFIEELQGSIQKTDFTEKIFNEVKKFYRSGVNIKDAFARYLGCLLKDHGLIICDPSDSALKKFMIPVFEKEITGYPSTCEEVVKTSADIEQNYELQLKPKPLNFFYIYNDSRYPVEPKEDDSFGLRNTSRRFGKEEFLELLDTHPENFSPNVVLRPIVQDFILPTVAYIGGPSEISYFGQLKGVYKRFGITMPVLYPRTSAAFIESRVKNFFEKYSVSYSELLDENAVAKKLLKDSGGIDAEKLFDEYIQEFGSINSDFAQKLDLLDVNLTNNFRNRAEKYSEGLEQLKKKFIDSALKQNEVTESKLKGVLNNLFPNGILQERVLNIVYYLNKYDADLINFIYEKLNIFDFNHQLIDLTLKHAEKPEKE